jgi:hypothetical protein
MDQRRRPIWKVILQRRIHQAPSLYSPATASPRWIG